MKKEKMIIGTCFPNISCCISIRYLYYPSVEISLISSPSSHDESWPIIIVLFKRFIWEGGVGLGFFPSFHPPANDNKFRLSFLLLLVLLTGSGNTFSFPRH